MIPAIALPMVDVRDVALLHLQALKIQEAAGKRFLATSAKPYSFLKMAELLKENGYAIPTPRQAPSLMLRLLSRFNRELAGVVGFVDRDLSSDNRESLTLLQWQPLDIEKTLLDTAKKVASLQSNKA